MMVCTIFMFLNLDAPTFRAPQKSIKEKNITEYNEHCVCIPVHP